MIQYRSANKIRMTVSLALLLLLILVACSISLTSTNAASSNSSISNTWSVSQNGTLLEIAYGSGTSFPQYAALDLNSSYFRMIYSSSAGWGTSVILLPVYWSQTSCPPPGLCQGAPITAHWQIVNTDLVLSTRCQGAPITAHWQIVNTDLVLSTSSLSERSRHFPAVMVY